MFVKALCRRLGLLIDIGFNQQPYPNKELYLAWHQENSN
jgi:hypothetical protein